MAPTAPPLCWSVTGIHPPMRIAPPGGGDTHDHCLPDARHAAHTTAHVSPVHLPRFSSGSPSRCGLRAPHYCWQCWTAPHCAFDFFHTSQEHTTFTQLPCPYAHTTTLTPHAPFFTAPGPSPVRWHHHGTNRHSCGIGVHHGRLHCRLRTWFITTQFFGTVGHRLRCYGCCGVNYLLRLFALPPATGLDVGPGRFLCVTHTPPRTLDMDAR